MNQPYGTGITPGWGGIDSGITPDVGLGIWYHTFCGGWGFGFPNIISWVGDFFFFNFLN